MAGQVTGNHMLTHTFTNLVLTNSNVLKPSSMVFLAIRTHNLGNSVYNSLGRVRCTAGYPTPQPSHQSPTQTSLE